MRIPANRFHAAISLTLILAMLSLTACNGSDSPAGSGGSAGVAVNGAATGPGGAIAKMTSPSKSWFASLFEVAEAFAQQVTGWTGVPNATVRVFHINDTGAPVGTTVITFPGTIALNGFSPSPGPPTVFATLTAPSNTHSAQVEPRESRFGSRWGSI